MKAWISQQKRQIEKLGKSKAPWYVRWTEPDGRERCKMCGTGKAGKDLAIELRDQTNQKLTTGTYYDAQRKTVRWPEFVKEYRAKILCGLATNSLLAAEESLDRFSKLLNLETRTLEAITTEAIDTFRAARRKQRGRRPESTIAPATINKDLRHLKAALNVAVEWRYLKEMPVIRFEKEPDKLPRYVTAEHFGQMYAACDKATAPNVQGFEPADWWRGLLAFLQMTGWRIGEALSLEWSEVDLETGRAITLHTKNKGKRDSVVALHPAVIDHIKPLKTFASPNVFHWPGGRRQLYEQFDAIQTAAGIHLPCTDATPHECTESCHKYNFHDERRSFATLNAPNMDRKALQTLMRHASPATTEKYIAIATKLNPAVANLVVPDALTTKRAAN